MGINIILLPLQVYSIRNNDTEFNKEIVKNLQKKQKPTKQQSQKVLWNFFIKKAFNCFLYEMLYSSIFLVDYDNQ